MHEALPPSAFPALGALPAALIRLERGLPANSSGLRRVTPPWAPSPLSQRPRSKGCAGVSGTQSRWRGPALTPGPARYGQPAPAGLCRPAGGIGSPVGPQTHPGGCEQAVEEQSRALLRGDAQLRAQPQHSPGLPASQLRKPDVRREQVFCPLGWLPRGGSPCHGNTVPRCHGSCGRAGRAARGVTVLALRAAEGGKERDCPCCCHAPEGGDGEPRADCIGEMWGVCAALAVLGPLCSPH